MVKSKNIKVLFVLCVIAIVFSAFASVWLFVPAIARAEIEEGFSAEGLTEQDGLLDEDGKVVENYTIRDFAKNVKRAYPSENIEDLDKVIPLQYLKSDATNAVFQYMGKEYGFYVAKEGERFDVFLIDFVYEFDDDGHSDVEYKIEINPILQQSFMRSVTADGYEFKKCDGGYTYYVANPRFLALLQNENALNYGDVGYSKKADNGLIILQTRVNHGVVGYSTGKNLEFGLFSIAANVAIDCMLPTGLSALWSVFEGVGNMFGDIQEVVSEANNELNIETGMSKEAQQLDVNLDGLSRLTGFLPTDEMILSDDENSYAEYITELDNGNYKSRLTQVCEFDIVRRNSRISSMEYVNTNENAFSFSIERRLFADKEPLFDIDGWDFEIPVNVYMLENGNQNISFSPRFSGEYQFSFPNGARLTIDGISGNKFLLSSNRNYELKLENLQSNTVIGKLQCALPQVDLPISIDLESGQNQIIKYRSAKTERINLQFTTPAKIELLDSDFEWLKQSEMGNLDYNFVAGETYYLFVSNTSNSFRTISIEEVEKKYISMVSDYTVYDKVLGFVNRYNEAKEFHIVATVSDGGSISVYDSNYNAIASGFIDRNVEIITFQLGANEECNIVSSMVDGSIKFSISAEDIKYKWVINGKEASNNVNLPRQDNDVNDPYKNGHTIQLYVKSGSGYIEVSQLYIDIDDDKYTLSNGILYIHYTSSIGDYVYIRYNHDLTCKIKITFIAGLKDKEHTITLKTLDWDNTIEKVIAHYGDTKEKIKINKPVKKGNNFLGYFDGTGNNAKQYFDKDMKIVGGSLKIQNDITLYAHWDAIPYNITFRTTNQNGTFDTKAVAYYGEYMPSLELYPSKDGYYFNGYWYGGKMYYKMEVVNYEEAAMVNGVSKYMCEKAVPCCKMDVANDLLLTADFQLLACEYEFKLNIYGGGQLGTAKANLTHNRIATIKAPDDFDGYTFRYYDFDGPEATLNPVDKSFELERSTSDGKVYPKKRFSAIYQQTQCVAAGTLITLADGRQVPVESLTGNEMLLVWNLQTGTFDSARILFIDKEAAANYRVINLTFSDGTTVKVISEHAFWDYDLNEYVYLRADASKYIGHWFNKQITNENGGFGTAKVQLINVEVKEEYVATYSPVTAIHLCYYVNGMLSIPGGIGGLFNIFEVDSETMTIDYEAFEQDIQTYGLFTYEEFAEVLPVSEEMFEAFNGQYLKVAIGKGLIDIDTLIRLAQRYSPFFE